MRPKARLSKPRAAAWHAWRGWRAALAISVAAAWPQWAAASDLDGLRTAASRGDSQALFELGSRYEQADGVEHDIGLAAQYLRLAAERGHKEAQYRLGLLYAAGLGLPKDLEQSYEWLTLAAAGDGRAALLAAALGEAVATGLPPAAVTRAQQLAAGFQPVSDLPKLPEVPDAQPAEAGTAPARDPLAELTVLLARANCGEPTLSRDDRDRMVAAGYWPAGAPAAAADGDIAKLLEQRGITLELTPLAPELCAVLDLIAAAGKGEPAEVVARDPEGTPKQVFRNDEYLVVELRPLPAAGYAAVDYFIHDGSVVHMLPSLAYPRNRLPAGAGLVLGDPGAAGQVWQVSPPFGRDLLVVFVSERPLYEGQRPGVEPIDDYLNFLKERLAGGLPSDTVRIGYRVIQTESG